MQYRCSTGILNITMAWTQATIDNLKPRDKSYKKQENNLVVKVQPTGYISYFAYIRRKYQPLGKHPELSLRQAKMKKEGLFHDMYMGKLEETKITFKEFVFSKDFQEWSEGNRKTHHARMASMKATILPIIGSVKLAKLDLVDINRYKNKRLKAGVKRTTINRELNDISGVLTQAHSFKLINQTIKVEKFSEDRGKERRVLEDWEVRALRESAHSFDGLNKRQADQKKHIGLVIDIALWCGLRKGEILQLQWGDIVNKGHYLQELDKQISESGDLGMVSNAVDAAFSDYAFQIRGDTTKTGQSRLVPISKQLIEKLMEYYVRYVSDQSSFDTILKNLTESDLSTGLSEHNLDKIFFQPQHKEQRIFPFSKVDNSFNTARDKAGLEKDITLHTLRHNFCSKALESGMSLHTVKDLAGHASITTTEIYLHTNPRLKFMEYQRFNDVMSSITG